MARYVCDNCGTTVTDEQFCPSCGGWIDPMKEVDEGDGEDFEEFSLEEPPPAPDPQQPVRVPRQEVQCPSCGSNNPATNRHCEECGARISQGALPVAPRPAVHATAGVRAAMAIAGLLVGVVLIALLFNVFTGEESAATTAAGEDGATTTTAPAPEPGPIDVLSVNCSVPGIAGFECRNLADGNDGEYQIGWEDLEEGQEVTIEMIFAEPMVLTGFVWENLDEGDRFYQNYRAQAVSVVDGTPNAVPLTLTLSDQPGSQPVEYASLRTLKLSVTVETVYFPQERNGQIFTELAIKGIQPIGYPAPSTDAPATSSTTTEG